ncbi:MAG TPA: DUF4838 domain-containing protein, partial [Armatimonadota bacterium]|nr:DUF4838 domain-containing protein [Armatimonadota bacterium]
INDGAGYCECATCKTVDRPMPTWHGFSGDKSHLYYTWLNRVAENLEQDHPDKMLGCLAYSAAILPPVGMKLHRNIIPYFTSNRADYWDHRFKRQDQQMLNRWSRSTSQMGIYDYAYGMGFAVPRIYNHLFQGAIQHAVDHGVRGFYAEVYPNWGLDGHKLYVMSRILWDPDVDVDALTDEWNERMFREAAGPMKAYFARCERAWREEQKGTGHWAYRLAGDPAQFGIFPSHILEECTGYLDQAARLAKDALVKDRIHFFRKTWDITLLLAGNYHASGNVQELIDEGGDIADIAAAMREAADRSTVADIDAFVKGKVGDDRIAYHDTQRWFARLKAGAVTNASRWCAAHLANAEIERARQGGSVDAVAVRSAIDARVTETFGTAGSDSYRLSVSRIRGMALKVATVVRTPTAPTVDGVIDDDAWKDADVLGDFIKYGESAPADHATRVRLVHDGANLFVALECEQDTTNLKTESAPRDGNTWHDDSVEMFINPEMAETPYVQFIINARGAFFDHWKKVDTESYAEALSRNFDCEWAATVEDGRWTAETRLPLREFGCDPSDHPLLMMDFIRNVQGDDPEISAWFPSIAAHADPLSRGWIVFE